MSRRKKSLLLVWAEYGLIRLAAFMVGVIPWSAARWAARRASTIIRIWDRFLKGSRQELATKNLRDAFPDLPPSEIKALVRRTYESLAESAVDSVMLLQRVQRDAAGSDRCVLDGTELLDDANRESGTLCVTGHFGCWEALALMGAQTGLPVMSLARPLPNPLIDAYVNRLRESVGQTVLPKRGSMRAAIQALREGKNLAFVIDQDARRDGIFVEFFGKPASTVSSVARLSLKTGAPVAFAYARRIPGTNRFRGVIEDVIYPDLEADEKSEIDRITQRFTTDLENVIRRWPAEWLWLHRRWKTYPGKYPEQEVPERFADYVRSPDSEPDGEGDRLSED